ncbi:MAG: hypothetical protein BYD32DRAFT_466144 [Podila humilis]|nr:MAG: hypothetical protein BYD32DRAFT_466144 [Podila humilis]
MSVTTLSVATSSSGPNFDEPYAEDLLQRIHHLHVCFRLFDLPLPTYGYLRLSSLTISPIDESHNVNMWASLIEVVQNLAKRRDNPLSTIELNTQAGSLELWSALSTCHQLRSLTLVDLQINEPKFPAFWKVCSTVESIHLCNTKAQAYGHPAESAFRKRLLYLKQLTMEDASALLWSGLSGQSSLPWIRAPNLETVSLTGEEILRKSDLKNWVLDIAWAKQAADFGGMFYGRDGIEYDLEYVYATPYEVPDNASDIVKSDEEDLDMEQYDGLIPGEKIHSFECRYPPLDYGGSMSTVIENMHLVQKMSINRLKSASRCLESLSKHLETLVELNIWQSYLPSTTVVMFLE